MTFYPFGQWEPDSPDFGKDGMVSAQGVVPKVKGYRVQNSLTPYSTALDDRARGAGKFIDEAEIPHTYAGTQTKLYELVQGTMADRSKTGDYSLADEGWEYSYFNGSTIATSLNAPIQGKDASDTNAKFADYVTSTRKPQARHVTVLNNFLVLGNTNDSTDGRQPRRVWWSALGVGTDFDPAASTQSGFADLTGREGGQIMKVLGGEYGTIFRKNSIWRMDYLGPGLIFGFSEMEPSRGCFVSGGVVGVGRNYFYLAEDGFYLYTGDRSEPVGAGKVNRHFFRNVDINYLDRISSARDPDDTVVYWLYPGSGSGGLPNRLLAYNWAYGGWAETELDPGYEWLLQGTTEATTLEGLDSIFATLEDVEPSMDSDVWKGGDNLLGAFDNEHKLGFFQGPPQRAFFESGDYQPYMPQRSKFHEFRPYVEPYEGGSAIEGTLTIGTRERGSDDIAWRNAVSLDSHGTFHKRVTGRISRFRLEFNNGARNVTGIDVIDPLPAGRR